MLWLTRVNTALAEKAASDVVQAELYNIIMHHSGCHTSTRLSQKVTIIEICIWRTCQEVLHALDSKSKHGVGQEGRLRGCTSGIV